MARAGGPGPGRPAVGERIKLLRLQRHLSRRVVANLVGRSEEWLRLVESGRRRLENVQVMIRLADVLQVDDFNEFIDRPARRGRRGKDAGDDLVLALRKVIVDHPGIQVAGEAAGPVESMQVESDELGRCQEAWASSSRRYSVLAERLPAVLAACRILQWQAQSAETADMLIRAYHLSRELLTRTGAHNLALIVADRAMTTAGQIKWPVLMAASAWHFGNALLYLDQADECRRYAVATAERLSMWSPDSANRTYLWGALHLLAAKGAAATPDPLEAERLLRLAQAAAVELSEDRRICGLVFGPTEIGIARIEMALGQRDFDEVVRIAGELEVPDGYPVGGRARFRIAVAYAFARRGDDVAAASTLSRAADACAEDLRYDPDARRTLQLLMDRRNHLVRTDVVRLAALIDLD
nr:helix-turn-helix transcriptional regulator [Nocardia terpenica]